MAGVHAVEGVSGGAADQAAHQVSGHDSASGGGANAQDPNSGDVFGISSEWVDDQGNIKSSGVHDDTHGGGLGQQGAEHGEQLNVNEVAEAAKAMGMTDEDIQQYMDDFTGNEANFNPGQTDDQKKVGAVLALNEQIAAANINHTGMSKEEVEKTSGDAMEAARAGDAGQLRSVLEGAGGNTGDMTDQQLLNVWSSNPHLNNHAILNTNSEPFQLTHLRSTSAADAEDGTGGDPVGYRNDKQDWEQWGAYDDANNFLQANKLFA
jgi:hypothetical protein